MHRALVLTLLLLAPALAGCGSSDTGRSFRSRAEAACQDMKRSGALRSGRKPSDADIRALARSWQRSIARLSRLQPPRTQAKDFQTMVDGLRDAAKALDLLGRLHDENVLAAVAAIGVAGDRATRAARRLDLAGCIFFPQLPPKLRPGG
jgi:hypothetical protein